MSEKILFIEATHDTFTKAEAKQSSSLKDDEKEFVKAGETRGIVAYEEDADESDHYKVTLAAGAGERFVYIPHWKFPHNIAVDTSEYEEEEFKYPDVGDIDWGGSWDQKVGKYFTLGEVCKCSEERRVTKHDVKVKVLRVAKLLDQIREEFSEFIGRDVAFRVTSWHRPWSVNRRIGSRSANHPNGGGVDFFPVGVDIKTFQDWFLVNWYNTKRWQWGFGKGARKGFNHIDLEWYRCWDY